jgi:hypothetical protein
MQSIFSPTFDKTLSLFVSEQGERERSPAHAPLESRQAFDVRIEHAGFHLVMSFDLNK